MVEVRYSFQTDLDEIPEELDRNTVYVCSGEGLIALICPCGCNARILLNTLKDAKPLWKFVSPNTILPSVNRQVGCRSHFSIHEGIVVI